jgi:FKBP-type peptidyl-prolyl cis-trans isomerase SlyD
MIIENDKVVSFDYTLKDSHGEELDSSAGGAPLTYLHGASNIIPGLEAELTGKKTGDRLTTVIAPEDAYGIRDEEAVAAVPKSQLGDMEGVEVGMQLQAETPDGPRIVTVAAVDDENVTIDANHPLAGVSLHFDVTVTEVRDATADELEHGHVHGPGCDH